MAVARLVGSINGIALAYLMALVNSLLSVLISFGVPLRPTQQAAVTTFANAALVVLAHVGHKSGEQAQRRATGSPPPAKPPS